MSYSWVRWRSQARAQSLWILRPPVRTGWRIFVLECQQEEWYSMGGWHIVRWVCIFVSIVPFVVLTNKMYACTLSRTEYLENPKKYIKVSPTPRRIFVMQSWLYSWIWLCNTSDHYLSRRGSNNYDEQHRGVRQSAVKPLNTLFLLKL